MLLSLLSLFYYETKDCYGASWLKVFYHDSSTGSYFQSYSEALSINLTKRYSIIGSIDERFKNNDKFEFLLEYPQYNKINRWKQTLNPKDNPEVEGMQAEGYEAVNISFHGKSWGGLVKSSDSRTALDGSAGSLSWYFSIGCYTSSWKPNLFPGPAIDSDTAYAVSEVYMWVRIDNTPYKSTYNAKKKSILSRIGLFFAIVM